MHKTQVFLAPEGDHYRTRLTHTLEVSQVARTIARALNLNEDLTEAIAMGHDLGHTPFGHNGETILDQVHGHFSHNEQSLRVVDILETTQSRIGLNLTEEVRDGILNHSGKLVASTLEGQIVALSDRIAYINHDIDDAIRSGVIDESQLPRESIELFGHSHRERIDTMVRKVIENSQEGPFITMGEEYGDGLLKLRDFMFENVYRSNRVKKEEDLAKVEVVITSLYQYFLKHPEKLPKEYERILETDHVSVAVKDYIAGMTDRFAIRTYKELFVPKGWR